MSSSMGGPGRRLRVLCLHGYGHNGGEFIRSLADLARLAGDKIELVPLDGAISLEGDIQRCWWRLQKCYQGRTDLLDEQVAIMKSDLQASLNELSAAWHTLGPFDGVLGFSQGGVLSAIVLQLQEIEVSSNPHTMYALHIDPVLKFKFALLFNCCQSRSISHLKLPPTKISTTTLLAVARNDPIISIHAARSFREGCFKRDSLTYFEHDGGHWLPIDDNFRELFVDFISKAHQTLASC